LECGGVGGWGEKNSSMKLYELFHLELIKWWNFTKWMKLIVIQIWMYVDERPTYIKYILNLQVNLQFFFCYFFFFWPFLAHFIFYVLYLSKNKILWNFHIFFSNISNFKTSLNKPQPNYMKSNSNSEYEVKNGVKFEEDISKNLAKSI
jgi:hypothetical protein